MFGLAFRHSLPLRLSLVSMVFAGLVAAVLTALGGVQLHRQQQDNALKSARIAGDALAARAERLLALGLGFHDFIGFDALCADAVRGDAMLAEARVYDAALRGWHGNRGTPPGWPLGDPQPGAGGSGPVDAPDGWVVRPIRREGGELLGWVRVDIAQAAVLQATLQRVVWLVATAALLFALGLVVQQGVFWRSVGRPLAALVETADSLKAGQLPALAMPAAEAAERDDIGRLQAAFARLVERLRAAQQALIAQNEALEATVRERTQALEQANAELERDIRRRQELEDELRRSAATDALTDLANRAFILPHAQARMEAARRDQRQVALMVFDLDGFKAVNDTHGHAVGDEVLRAVAQRLRQVCRGADVLARLGGDEFLLVAEGPGGPEVFEDLARRVVRQLDTPLQVAGAALPLGISAGVALFPLHGPDFSSVLAEADAAMYRAKSAGGGVALAPAGWRPVGDMRLQP